MNTPGPWAWKGDPVCYWDLGWGLHPRSPLVPWSLFWKPVPLLSEPTSA